MYIYSYIYRNIASYNSPKVSALLHLQYKIKKERTFENINRIYLL